MKDDNLFDSYSDSDVILKAAQYTSSEFDEDEDFDDEDIDDELDEEEDYGDGDEEEDDDDYDEDDDEIDEGYESPGSVAIDILTETEASYQKAIDFLAGLLEKGFSVRCDFSCRSTAENCAPILDGGGELVYQNDRNQFWANAAQYPALRNDIRKYALFAAKKVRILSGDEMEEDDSTFRRPDFYAMAALSLSDPTAQDFVDLIIAYIGTIDLSYASSAVFRVAVSYMKKWGVSDENIDALARGCDSELLLTYLLSDYFNKAENKPAIKKLIDRGNELGVDTESLEGYYEK